MNGIHDIGGMDGFGVVDVEASSPFHGDWEKWMHAIRYILGAEGYFNGDELRFAVENRHPVDYLTAGYYGLRALAIEDLLRERSVISEEEFTTHLTREDLPHRSDPDLTQRVYNALESDVDYQVPAERAARFTVGDHVTVRNIHPRGHTRAPRYIRRATGKIIAEHGSQRLPDAGAEGNTDVGDPLYSVEFTMREVWGDDHSERDTIVLQLWDSYLKPV